jgi:sugar diacid utilization regulator
MFQIDYFKSFLAQREIVCFYQIWIKNAGKNCFSLIDSYGNGHFVPPEQIPEYDIIKQSVNKRNNQTDLWMKYPEEFQMVVCLSKEVLFSIEELNTIYHYFYPCYTDYYINSAKRNIEKIIETTHDISSSLDLDNLLNKIVANALSVIPAADVGVLWMHDPGIDRLICKAYAGDVKEDIKRMRIRQGEGIVGKVFVTGIPRLYNDMESIVKDTSDFSVENSIYLDSTFSFLKDSILKAAVLSMPITVNGKIECVMMMYQTKSDGSITENDIQLFSTFCNQVAIAIINARMFADLKEQNDLLKKRDEIHSTLTKISLQNKGVENIVKALSKMIGIPLIFVDFIENEFYAKNIKWPDDLNYDQLYQLLYTQESPFAIDFTGSGSPTHSIFPITTGTAYLGCLIIDAKHSLTRLDNIALEQANSIISLEMIKKQSILDIYYRKTYESFNKLLQNSNNSTFQYLCTEFGLDSESYFAAVMFEFNHPDNPYILEINMHSLISQIRKKITQSCKIVFGFNRKVHLLITPSNNEHMSSIINKLKEVIDDFNATRGILLRACIGSLYFGIDFIEKTYNEANKGLSYLIFHNLTGLIQYAKIGLNRLFINYSNDDIVSFLMEIFDPLRTSKSKNIKLEETLLAFIDSNCSTIQAAKKLHIHINTLYQRLSKIEQLLKLSFDNPENVLQIRLACYLKQSFEY